MSYVEKSMATDASWRWEVMRWVSHLGRMTTVIERPRAEVRRRDRTAIKRSSALAP